MARLRSTSGWGVLLSLGLALPGVAADCTGRMIAELYSLTSFGMGGQITLTFWGEAQTRQDILRETTLMAEVERSGCTFSAAWPQENILYAAAISP
jgi:hypothetical protein